jgi:hypothetical protein
MIMVFGLLEQPKHHDHEWGVRAGDGIWRPTAPRMGARPNKLVSITDQPSATSPAAGESFQTVQTAANGQVLRGVSFTPGTGASGH